MPVKEEGAFFSQHVWGICGGIGPMKFYLYKMRGEWTLQLAGGGVWDAWVFESWEKAQSFIVEMLAHPLRMYRHSDNMGCLQPYSVVE